MKNIKCCNCANYRNKWCELVVDSPHPDILRDCQYYWQKTNADHIRSMTDEELAKTFDCQFETCPPNTAEDKWCDKNADCEKCWLDWLKQSYKEGSDED